jgi:hypothetical protein
MFFIAVTPTLSQREREPLGAALQSPLPRERARVKGRSCCDFSGFKVFETASTNRHYTSRVISRQTF